LPCFVSAAGIFKPNEITAQPTFTTSDSSISCSGTALRDRKATHYPTGAIKTLTNVVTGGTDPSGTPYTGDANLTWNFVPDAFGNIKQATDPTGYQLTYVYDAVAQDLSNPNDR